MLDRLTKDDFSGRLGETFRVILADESSLDVELAEVAPLGVPPPPGRREGFSLIFHGPAEPVLAQAIHRLEHEGLGALDLFLVPLGPKGEAMQYEAVFN